LGEERRLLYLVAAKGDGGRPGTIEGEKKQKKP